MEFISRRKRKLKNGTERALASEIVEIFEEKLENLNVKLIRKSKNDVGDEHLNNKIKNEIITEIEDLIYSNRNILT